MLTHPHRARAALARTHRHKPPSPPVLSVSPLPASPLPYSALPCPTPVLALAHPSARFAVRTFFAQKMRQTYDTDVENTYNSADEVADKKNIYVTIVGGLIAVAFIAPMLQFFYYTGGD